MTLFLYINKKIKKKGGQDRQMVTLVNEPLIHEALCEYYNKRHGIIAAIGQGVNALCNSIRFVDRSGGKSLLYGYNVCCLPKWMEYLYWWLTWPMYGDYHLQNTYPMTSQQIAELAIFGQNNAPYSGQADRINQLVIGSYNIWQLLFTGNEDRHQTSCVCEDECFITARFAGDVHLFSQTFIHKLFQKLLKPRKNAVPCQKHSLASHIQ
ncbi:hypothetical protein RFI_29765 [Reticulomyxa filosa]|uniref:Uncharacterized protein n=1 Tax=Reticulomyxa filosa TaxID=46433 RepID=X6M2I1_RETFI|nr:hypothetical protein RFI_29765 [Reticulomyxa filosa]|eukprot:ETO07627.1 hypothetical protein RFI_29765 [Reticulomyxa filosa]